MASRSSWRTASDPISLFLEVWTAWARIVLSRAGADNSPDRGSCQTTVLDTGCHIGIGLGDLVKAGSRRSALGVVVIAGAIEGPGWLGEVIETTRTVAGARSRLYRVFTATLLGLDPPR